MLISLRTLLLMTRRGKWFLLEKSLFYEAEVESKFEMDFDLNIAFNDGKTVKWHLLY